MITLKGLANDLQEAVKIGREKVIERFSDNAVMVRSEGGSFGIRYMRKTNFGNQTDTYGFFRSQSAAHTFAKEKGLIPCGIVK